MSVRAVSIGEVVERVSTWSPAKLAVGDFDYIDLSAVDQDHKRITMPNRISTSDAPSRARQIVRNRDVLVSTVRPNLNGVAKVMEEHDGMTASTGFCVLRPDGNLLNSNYLFQWVKSPGFIHDMVQKATGASYPAVSDRIIKESEIPLPPLDEQKRIAAILDKADQLRQKRRQAIALLDSLTQSIFLEMFGNIVENDKALAVGDISHWVANFETGKNLAPDPDNSDPLSYRVLKVSAVTSGIFKPGEAKALPKTYTPPPSHIVRKGDLLFSRANTAELIGATALVNGDCNRLVLPDKIWRFVWRTKNQPNPIFMHGLFSSAAFREEISKRASGTSGSMKNISKEKVLGIRVGQPERYTQDEYARRVGATTGCRLQCVNQLSIFDAQFASLQHRAFSGQL